MPDEQPITAEMLQQSIALAVKEAVAAALKAANSSTAHIPELISSLNARLPTFNYDASRDDTFAAYYDRYSTIITEDGSGLSDEQKVRLLIGKLDTAEYNQFADSVKPKSPYEQNFKTTVELLLKLFAPVRSLVMKRYEFFSLTRAAGSDVLEFTTKLNATCERAVPPLDADQLKCLRLVSNLNDVPDLRTRCLLFLERKEASNEAPKFSELVEEVRGYMSVKASAAQFEQAERVSSYAITSGGRNDSQKRQKRTTTNAHSGATDNPSGDSEVPRGQCFSCGGPHLRSTCRHRNSKCHTCGLVGHVSKVCRKSKTSAQPVDTGRVEARSSSPRNNAERTDATKDFDEEVNYIQDSSEIPAPDNSGFGTTPIQAEVSVNGRKIRFSLDTGADATILSLTAYKMLGRPWLQALNLYSRFGEFRKKASEKSSGDAATPNSTSEVSKFNGASAKDFITSDFVKPSTCVVPWSLRARARAFLVPTMPSKPLQSTPFTRFYTLHAAVLIHVRARRPVLIVGSSSSHFRALHRVQSTGQHIDVTPLSSTPLFTAPVRLPLHSPKSASPPMSVVADLSIGPPRAALQLYDAPGPVHFALAASLLQVQGQLRLQQQPSLRFTPQRFALSAQCSSRHAASQLVSSSSQLKLVRHLRTSD
ncbi:hypothetical protein AAVH_22252 [Aphelenchoides avenae]|nr:hypothetical protein AAVH_22252 [Aphelenchus avenae]